MVLLKHQESARERRAVLTGAYRPVVIKVDTNPCVQQLNFAEIWSTSDRLRLPVSVTLIDVGGDLLVETRLDHVLEVATKDVAIGPQLQIWNIETVAGFFAIKDRLLCRICAVV